MKMIKDGVVVETTPFLKNIWAREGFKELEETEDEKSILIGELEAKGIEFDKRWGIEKLKKALEA